MTSLGKCFQNSGEIFGRMAKAWREELECGHLRGQPVPFWFQLKPVGVMSIHHDLLQNEVETGLGACIGPKVD